MNRRFSTPKELKLEQVKIYSFDQEDIMVVLNKTSYLTDGTKVFSGYGVGLYSGII